MQTYQTKNEDPTGKVIVSYLRKWFQYTCKQRISNVVKNTFVRNLEQCGCHIYKYLTTTNQETT